MVKKRTTSIPSPETSYIPPKIEKTEAEPIDLMPEAVMKQSLPESAPISPPFCRLFSCYQHHFAFILCKRI